MSKWEWKKLGDLYPIVMGKTPPRGDPSCWDKSKRTNNVWVTIADISSNENQVITESKEYISDKATKNISLVSPKSLLLSFKLSIGKMAFAGVPLYTNEAIVNFPPIKDIDLHYLHKYFLYYNWDKASEGDTKVKGKTLNKEKLKNIDIPVPPLSEQNRIVKFLDEEFSKIDTLKTNAETNLKNAKELFETTLEKELNPPSRHSERSEESSAELPSGWEWKKMRDVCEVTSSKRIFKDEYVKRGIPFYRTKEIKELSHGEPLSLELFISEEKYNQIKQKFGVPQIGDVLISAVGTIGEILVISNNNPFYFKDGNIIWLKNISLFDSIFLKYELKSIIDSLKAMTRGAAYNALTIEKLKECKIPLPPLSVQKEIIALLDKLSENVKRLEANYKQIIADCDELKKSILKKTFEGES